jgi:uncharacterized protein (DUF1697 family)
MRYVAFLRGVSPVNARMPELIRCFEKGGFEGVKTLLSSGNVVFDAPRASPASLERRIEALLEKHLDRAFPAIVRSARSLAELLRKDPFEPFLLEPVDKRIVTFLRKPFAGRLALPIELHGARILAVDGCEVFSAYRPTDKGPVFMALIERTFGKDVTTRTWQTLAKCAAA